MATCPAGHDSNDLDFCDVCGADMVGSAVPASAPRSSSHLTPPPNEPVSRSGEACPRCGTPRTGRFCEEDGYDFVLGAERPPSSNSTAHLNVATPATPTIPTASTKLAKQAAAARSKSAGTGKPKRGWSAVISADRVYYDKVVAEGGPDAPDIAFPPYCPDRVVSLTGSQIRIGRRSVTRGVTPEIDLGVPPEDVGVSHIHAVLLARPDGSWVLVDPGSTNGTTVNGSTDPIAVNAEISVGDGDRIHVGAWTTITLRKD